MPTTTITINNTPFTLIAEEGEGDKVRELAKYVDAKITALKSAMGNVGDQRLLVLAAIQIADELAEAYAHIDAITGKYNQMLPANTASLATSKLEALAGAVDSIVKRLNVA